MEHSVPVGGPAGVVGGDERVEDGERGRGAAPLQQQRRLLAQQRRREGRVHASHLSGAGCV
jgi:hypothetical protein